MAEGTTRFEDLFQLGLLFDGRGYGSTAHFDVALATCLPGGTFTTTRVFKALFVIWPSFASALVP